MNAELRPEPFGGVGSARNLETGNFDGVFDLVVATPGGVKKIRELVLRLAVRGKLLIQDRDDEPVDELLARLQRARAALEKCGKVPGNVPQKASVGNNSNSKSDVPNTWKTVAIRELAWPQAGFAFKAAQFNDKGVGLPLIRIRDVGVNYPRTFYSGAYRDEFIVQHGDWLVSMDGEFRVCPWLGPPALLNQRVTRLRFFSSEVEPLFVCIALQEKLRELQGTKAYTTVDHLSGKQIAETIVPVPPASEQRRIVARVRDLLTFCDSLEETAGRESEHHSRLTSELFGSIISTESSQALTGKWQRVGEHFDLLLDRPEAVDALERTLDALAVRGMLIAQEPREQSTVALLECLASLNADGNSVARRQHSSASDDVPFDLPMGWQWVQAQDLCRPSSLITYGILKPVWVDAGVPTVRVQDMQDGVIALHAIGQCSHERAGKFKKTTLEAGDLVIAKDGATLGKTAFVPPSLAGGNITQHVLRFPITPCVDADFVRLVVDSPYGQSWMRTETKGVALPGVNVGDFRRMPIPIPPLAEQQRIVTRVKELRHLCAKLRKRLTEAQRTQSELANALVGGVA